MQKLCRQCGAGFEISDQDRQFYDKVSSVIGEVKVEVSLPTLCPCCRQQRRFTFRNERNLYRRKCDLTGKQIISNYSIDSPYKAYDQEEWWSDKWDPKEYGRDYDFNKSFFEQFDELAKDVPQLALSVWNSENSTYCNYVGHVKSSYLIFGSVYSEDCYYGSPYYSKNCLDTLVVRECEYCYECIDCRKLYECFYCQDCHTSANLIYCFDLQGCSDCIACAGLRKKKYYIFNKKVSREKYEDYLQKLNLCDPEVHRELSAELEKLKLQIPRRYMQSKNIQNVTGNYIYQSKNVLDSYYADRSEDCRYCAQVVDLKDCYDNNYTEENELCLDYLGSYQNSRLLFSKFCNKVSDSLYLDSCFTSKNLFGCVGLRNSEYCILNKQYTKEDYEKLVLKIIDKMRERGEWGEFFPTKISPFSYNETVAQEYFPMEKEEVLEKGLRWKEEVETLHCNVSTMDISKDIKDIPDSITGEALTCTDCNKNYKIIPLELKFYKNFGLPIPKKCPDHRHKERLAKRNPRKLFDRECMKCGKRIKTTFSDQRKEIVYCEECYLGEVFG